MCLFSRCQATCAVLGTSTVVADSLTLNLVESGNGRGCCAPRLALSFTILVLVDCALGCSWATEASTIKAHKAHSCFDGSSTNLCAICERCSHRLLHKRFVVRMYVVEGCSCGLPSSKHKAPEKPEVWGGTLVCVSAIDLRCARQGRQWFGTVGKTKCVGSALLL